MSANDEFAEQCPRCRHSQPSMFRTYDRETGEYGHVCMNCELRLADSDLLDEPPPPTGHGYEYGSPCPLPLEDCEAQHGHTEPWPKTAADYDIVNEMLDEAAIADFCGAVRR